MILDKNFELELKEDIHQRFFEVYKSIFNDEKYDKLVDCFMEDAILTIANLEKIDIHKHIELCRKAKLYIFNKFISKTFVEDSYPKIKDKKLDKLGKIIKGIKSSSSIELTKDAPKSFKAALMAYNAPSSEQMSFDFSYKNFQEYIGNILDELMIWYKENSSSISSFPYLEYVYKKTKILEMLKKDMFTMFYSGIISLQEENSNVQMEFSLYPYEYLELPIDPYNRKTITTKNENKYYHVQQLNETGTKTITSYIFSMDENNNVVSHKMINQNDRDVVAGLIRLGDIDFLTTRTVTCELTSLVKMVFGNADSIYYYKATVESLSKLTSYYAVYHDQETGDTINYKLLKADLVNESKEKVINLSDISKYQKLMVNAKFDEDFINRLINNATIINESSNDDNLDSLTKAMMQVLQGYRLSITNGAYTVKLGYMSYFCTLFVLSAKNKSRNIQAIENSLNTIKNKGIIIKSFKREKDYFYITFYPVSSEERRRILRYIEAFNKNVSLNVPVLQA